MMHRPGFASSLADVGHRLHRMLAHVAAGAMLVAVACTATAAPLTQPDTDKATVREAMATALGYRAV